MADVPRITVQELKRRMDAGEDFAVIDVRATPTLGGNGYGLAPVWCRNFRSVGTGYEDAWALQGGQQYPDLYGKS